MYYISKNKKTPINNRVSHIKHVAQLSHNLLLTYFMQKHYKY